MKQKRRLDVAAAAAAAFVAIFPEYSFNPRARVQNRGGRFLQVGGAELEGSGWEAGSGGRQPRDVCFC